MVPLPLEPLALRPRVLDFSPQNLALGFKLGDAGHFVIGHGCRSLSMASASDSTWTHPTLGLLQHGAAHDDRGTFVGNLAKQFAHSSLKRSVSLL